MHRLIEINSKKPFVAGLTLIGVAMIAVGVGFRPSLVVGHLNPNGFFAHGILERLTIVKLIRLCIFFIGSLFLLYGFLKATGIDSARRIEHTVEGKILPRLKQPRIIVIITFVLLALPLLNRSLNLVLNESKWSPDIGNEYFWIAEGLKGGHGYSLAANHRWYFIDFKSEYADNQFFPTALEEPVYPLLIAFALKNLGAYSLVAISLLQIVSLYLTALVVYLLIRKIFDSRLGIFSSIAMLTWWWFNLYETSIVIVSPAALGGLNIACSAYLLLWSLEKITVKRAVILGGMLAFSCLTLSAGLLFVPIAVLLTLILKKPLKPVAWVPALAILVSFGVILLPWTLRNYFVFGQFIPVRTGFGLALHQSNPALAATFSTGIPASAEDLGPIWRAKNAKDAIQQVRKSYDYRLPMYKRGYDLIEKDAPANYSEFNEAQRDKVYLRKSVEFIRSYPKIFLVLTRYRLQAFFVGSNSKHTLLTYLAFFGALMAWRNQKAVIMVMLIGAYTFNFSLITPLMYRYRYPIDPIMFVLASAVPIIALTKIRSATCKIKPQTTLPAT